MEQIKRRQLGAEERRALLARFAKCGLAVEAFCRRESISASSFYRWRAEVSTAPGREEVRRGLSSAVAKVEGFLDLGTLRPASARIDLRLDLGGGVLLHLVRE